MSSGEFECIYRNGKCWEVINIDPQTQIYLELSITIQILNENAKNVEYPLTNEQHLKYER